MTINEFLLLVSILFQGIFAYMVNVKSNIVILNVLTMIFIYVSLVASALLVYAKLFLLP